MLDPDDHVRTAAIQIFGQLNQATAQMIPMSVLSQLSSRCRDKKITPRQEAVMALCHYFKLMVPLKSKHADILWVLGQLVELVYLEDVSFR